MQKNKIKISIIGMGYVGLPLAIEFQKHYAVIGFDIKKERIKNLKLFCDETKEVLKKDLIKAKNLCFTYNYKDLKNSNVYIICVPTPLKNTNVPDLSSLKNACLLVSNCLKKMI